MFGWLFPPSCPCDPAAKEWLEGRLAWLADEFPDNVFTGRTVVRPTDEFFPDPYDGSRDAALTLFERVAGYMGVDPDCATVKFNRRRGFEMTDGAGRALSTVAGGTYARIGDRCVITLHEDEFVDPEALAGTIAHELAHHRLLGEDRIDPEVFDHELTTDLTAVFLGMGLFLANSPRNWPGAYSRWPGTDLHKPEYMTPPMFAYALAHIAWRRGEPRPPWRRHLKWHRRGDFDRGIRWLSQTGGSSFRPTARGG